MSKNEIPKIFWQAHRGGGAYEAPDNTLGANIYAWRLGGIPEADVRTTKDGVIVCLHDHAPARTTDAPDSVKDLPISAITFTETREWDAGYKFNEKFRGEKIPSLAEVFEAMQGREERMIYLDLKEVDLSQLGRLIDEYGVNSQVIFTHHQQTNCIEMKRIADGVRTMLWIGGNEQQIKQKFLSALENGFEGLDQVQLHLNSKKPADDWTYQIDRQFLEYALSATREAGVDLEVLPFQFNADSIQALVGLGIHWYATDEPARFLQCLKVH